MLQGNLSAAEVEVSKTVAQFPKLSLEWTWKFRLLSAEILNLQGLSSSVLPKIEPNFPPTLENGDLAVRRHMILGLAYARLGNFSSSEKNITQAEKECDAINCESIGEVARTRGAIEVRTANLPAADAAFRKSLQIARAKGDGFLEGTALLNLGVVALRDERYDTAIDWSNAARNTFHSFGYELTESKILGNVGWIYYKIGDYNQALAMTTEAQTQAHKLKAVLDEVRWLFNLGQIYFQIGQPVRAEEYYRKALGVVEQSNNTDLRFQVLTAFAFVSVQLGQLDAAERYKQEAFELASKEHDRSAIVFTLLIEGQLAALNKNYSRAEQLFTEVAADKESVVSLRWQAQNELARLHETQNQIARADHEYRQALTTVTCARAALAHEEFRLPFQANAADIYDDYIRFLVEHGRSDQALQVADYGRSMTLMEGLGITKEKDCKFAPHITTRAELAAQKSNSTILFYWLGHKGSYLWAIDRQNTSLFKLPSSDEIEAAVSRYRKLVLGPNDLLQSRIDPANDLYQMLVAPAARYLTKAPHVTIIPDQELNNLNFETLTVPGTKPHFWIEDATVTYASSLKVLATRNTISSSALGRMLLIGDPVVPDPKYPQLKEAATELEQIQSNYPQSQVQTYTRESATPVAYLNSHPESFNYIHFVAHGTASELSPLDSAIVLSKSTSEEDSFKLHAREIIQHPLKAELVTISACYGSGSTVYEGEGLVGLSWSFVRAGAHNVIGALWAVSDKSTSQLMAQMYVEIRKGRRPEDALRDAKLSLLHSGTVFRKPVYWAPFQFYVGS